MAAISTGISKATGHAKHRGRTAAIAAAVVVLLGAAGLFLGQKMYAAYRHQQEVAAAIDTKTFYPGIVVQGVDLGGKTEEEAKSALKGAEEALKGNYDVTVTYGGKSWQITQDTLGFSYNTDEILKEAYAYARTGDREQRYRMVEALKTSPKNWSIAKSVDQTKLKDTVNSIAKEASCDPVGPSVTGFSLATRQFSFADGKNGVKADAAGLLSEVQKVLASGGKGTVTVPVQSVPFTGSLSELRGSMKRLGSYETYSKNSAAGTHNMALALQAVNGTRVAPGGTFSFLGVVGPGDASQGYEKAGAILNGKLIQEDGGGICQASTTIYGAALRSAMTVAERTNHTIPSSYCPIGQDATVSYPSLDFKFKNPTAYPVWIVTSWEGRTMTTTLYGWQSPDYDSIDVTSAVTQTVPAPTEKQYEADPTLPAGEVKLNSAARVGYRASAQRIFYKNGAAVKTEALPSSYYAPQPAYYSYGKGTNLSQVKGGAPASSAGSSHAASTPAPQKPSSKPASSAPASKPSSSSASPASSVSSAAPPAADDDVTAAGNPAA